MQFLASLRKRLCPPFTLRSGNSWGEGFLMGVGVLGFSSPPPEGKGSIEPFLSTMGTNWRG